MTDYRKILNTFPIKNYLIDTIEFSCEIVSCDEKAAYRENITQMATAKNSDIYLCDNHFYTFKKYMEENLGINRSKIKARKDIQYKQMLRRTRPFDPNLLR